jgi:two-component system sensor histidine kinase/response regulator
MLREAVAGARAAPAQEAMRSIRAAGSGQLAGLRVLVVDDNPMNQQIAQLLLVHEGAEVDVAGGGAPALEMAAHEVYDAILMDVQMPDMDGYQCTRALRRLPACAAIPIIAMTANVMDSDREACLASGMDEHVGKPIDIAILAGVLLRHCRHISQVPAAAAPPAPLRAHGSTIEFEQALARLGGNRELFGALAGTYVQEAKQFLDQLGPALALPGYEGAPNILHTFKSAAGIVGAAELQNYAAGLESLLRSGAAVDAGLALKAVQLLVDISIADLALSVAAL